MNKLPDSEIVKALEICSKYECARDCKECPLKSNCDVNVLETLALDLINRQKEEIEGLKKELAKPILATKDLKVSFERIYRIGEEKALVQALKAEAYKEFVERLKKLQYLSIVDMVVSTKEIDNLLKELVGDSK